MAVLDGLASGSLSALHGLLALRRWLAWLWVWLYSSALFSFKHKGCKLACVQRDARSLSKIPLSLALVVQEEVVSHSDLARAVSWAVAAGVSSISLYDPYGTLERDVAVLRSAVQKETSQLFADQPCQVNVFSSAEQPNRSDTSGCTVEVLGPGSAQPRMVAAAVELSRAVVQGQLTVGEIQPSLLDSHIAGGSPAPDLTIVFGGSPCLVGYPPWQTRLTEILMVPTHHKVEYQQFLALLQRYACCQQRLGK